MGDAEQETVVNAAETVEGNSEKVKILGKTKQFIIR